MATSAVSERAGLGVTAVSGLALGLAPAAQAARVGWAEALAPVAGSPIRGAISVVFDGVPRWGRAAGRTPESRVLALCWCCDTGVSTV